MTFIYSINRRIKQVRNIDRYEWGQTISRIFMGSLVIALTAMDVNASSDILDANLNYEGSRIWKFATHSMV